MFLKICIGTSQFEDANMNLAGFSEFEQFN